MKKASYIFGIMKEYLNSKEFLEACKGESRSFIRVRVLSYKVLFLFILNLLRKSIPKELKSFCKNCVLEEVSKVSRAAITKARAKLAPCAFTVMNNVLVKEFYVDNPIKNFYGLIPVGIDGSTLELPLNSSSIAQKYGGATNQTNQKIPMARISQFYDLVNGIILDAIMAPYDASERNLAIKHFENIKKLDIDLLQKIVAIFDRGYPSLLLIVYLLKNNIHFLMRCNNQFLQEIVEVVKTNKRDTIVKIPLRKVSKAAKIELGKYFSNLDFNLKNEISIRVIVVVLSTGEKEVLLTSLLDKKVYPYEIFREFYFKRWCIEENYKFHKVCLETENFSGKTCHAIEQDFHATVLAANARSLLTMEAALELSQKSITKERKYVYQINKNISMDGLKDEFVATLFNPEKNVEDFCVKTKDIMKRNIVPQRPGRSFKRIRKHPHRKFHMNQR